ncbi:MAG: FHA domain-containing protein [Planctomycetes bacterium]|nr:FHA domain-containing protein [Planctomycetota bacterium]
MQAKLIVLDGHAKGREIPLPSSQFVIGRSSTCHLCAHSGLVSKFHCVIGRKAGSVVIRDLNSRNRTRVNNIPVSGTVRIQDGDILGVGPLRFRFVIEGKVTLIEEIEGLIIREDHVQWLMESGDTLDRDTGGDTEVIRLSEDFGDEDTIHGSHAEIVQSESVQRAIANKQLSAGKYFRDYFCPSRSRSAR